MRTYKAFVSSTFVDLKRHRRHVIAALRRAGIFVDPMEDWTAATDEPKRFSQARLEGCDLCVLLIGRRRGHVPQGEHRSITQMEADAAAARGIPILVFMLADDAPWPARFDDRRRDPDLGPWCERWRESKGVGFFGRDPASIEVAPALTRWIAESAIGTRDQARADVAAKATAAIVDFLLAVQLAERGAMPSQQQYDDAYLQWERAVASITADLHALDADETMHAGWRTLSAAVLGLYRLSGTWSEPWRGQLIAELKGLFPPAATDWSQLADVNARRASNEAFQRFFGAWWELRRIALEGCAAFGRRLLA